LADRANSAKSARPLRIARSPRIRAEVASRIEERRELAALSRSIPNLFLFVAPKESADNVDYQKRRVER